MFIEIVQNNGNPYIRLVQSVRVINKSGYKVSQKKVIKNPEFATCQFNSE